MRPHAGREARRTLRGGLRLAPGYPGYGVAWPRLVPGPRLAPGFGLGAGLGLGLGLGLTLGLGLALAPGLGLAAGLGQAGWLAVGLGAEPARLAGAVCR